MTLTAQQRAETVELLLCAADILLRGEPFPRLEAIRRLRASRQAQRASEAAVDGVPGPRTQFTLVEAAYRVAEKKLP